MTIYTSVCYTTYMMCHVWGSWEESDAGDMFVIKTDWLVFCSRLFTLSQVSYHHNEYLLRIFSQNTHYPPHHHHISSPSRIFALGTLEKMMSLKSLIRFLYLMIDMKYRWKANIIKEDGFYFYS